jgi:hypothetical protein
LIFYEFFIQTSVALGSPTDLAFDEKDHETEPIGPVRNEGKTFLKQ